MFVHLTAGRGAAAFAVQREYCMKPCALAEPEFIYCQRWAAETAAPVQHWSCIKISLLLCSLWKNQYIWAQECFNRSRVCKCARFSLTAAFVGFHLSSRVEYVALGIDDESLWSKTRTKIIAGKALCDEMLGNCQSSSQLCPNGGCGKVWETDFYPVPVLGRIVLSLWGCQAPAPY